MRTVEQINEEISALFEKHGVIVDGPGMEAFENACEDLEAIDENDAVVMYELAQEWERAQAASRIVKS